MCDFPLQTIGNVLTGMLTPLIAAVVAYIAWEQYQINRRQYRLALFEKRLVIYNAVMLRLAEVVQLYASPLQDNIRFVRETRDHEFLFGPEVKLFIDQIYKHGNNLMTLQAVQPRKPQDEADEVNWFNVHLTEARTLFFKYIDFTEKF